MSKQEKDEVPSEPSQHEVNRSLRVLKGERLKFTVRVHVPDRDVVEFQANQAPRIKFFEEDRCLWLHGSEDGYTERPIMKWIEGSILLIEENKS